MAKRLVAFFSVSGTTKFAADELASRLDADLFEIKPLIPYTLGDLNWKDPMSRSSQEMKENFKPGIFIEPLNTDKYETVFLGFPIWWHIAPTIVNSFLESYDFSGKKIVLFATSGGSGFGKTVKNLQPSAPSAKIIKGAVLNSRKDFNNFVKEYKQEEIC